MDAAKILFIGRATNKDASLLNALKKRYDLVVAANGAQSLALAELHQPHVVVVDAVSLRTPGDRICRDLRTRLGDVPIIHILPQNHTSSPADVILSQPFTSRKLVNCIERLLKLKDDQVVTCGAFSLNIPRRVLIAHGQETQLTPKLALLVEIFLRAPGQVISRKTLMEQVWKTDYLGDTRTLDVHIRWIRRAIESDPGKPRYLVTVRGVGYRLDAGEATPSEVLGEAETVMALEV
jgi:DNA-binding response OmpR family regulator